MSDLLNELREFLEGDSTAQGIYYADAAKQRLREIYNRHQFDLVLSPQLSNKAELKGRILRFHNDDRWGVLHSFDSRTTQYVFYVLPDEPNVKVSDLVKEEPLKVGDRVCFSTDTFISGIIRFIDEDQAWVKIDDLNRTFYLEDLKKASI